MDDSDSEQSDMSWESFVCDSSSSSDAEISDSNDSSSDDENTDEIDLDLEGPTTSGTRATTTTTQDDGWVRTPPSNRPNPLPAFSGNGPAVNAPLDSENPYLYFSKFVTDTLLEQIIEYTDLHAKNVLGDRTYMGYKWKRPTIDEMKQLLAILIVSDKALNPARMTDLWSRNPDYWLIKTPGFWNLRLSRRKFQTLKKFIRFSPANVMEDERDKVRYIRGLFDHLHKAFETEFTPGQQVTIDECMIPFKGRLGIKQYLKMKPVKWGLKADLLVDWATGYLLKFVVYSGKFDLPEDYKQFGKQGYMILCLMRGFEGQGFHLTTDRGYTSLVLAEKLAELGIGYCGTVMTNRKNFPKQLLKKKGKRGEWDYRTKGNLIAVRWYDNCVNYFLSNHHDIDETTVSRRDKTGQPIEVTAPAVVKDYNSFMNGVDKNDQNAGIDKSRKQYRWPLRFFIKMLKWCLKNAHVLMMLDFERNNPGKKFKMDMHDFSLKVSHTLAGEEPHEKPMSGRKHKEHCRFLRTILHTPKHGASNNKRCAVCEKRYYKAKKREKKHPGTNYGLKSVKTAFYCEPCGTPLCIKPNSNCWEKFHKQEEYWRPLPWEATPLPPPTPPTPTPGPSGDQ